MSLVEQTIARLKKQQGQATGRALPDRSPHGVAPGSPLDPEDTAALARQIPVDYAALRAQGYFPERDIDRQFAEQYRHIKRSLVDKALAGTAGIGEPRVVMVTSALPGDGKTFTSINLALSMALERDISVLLIDADVARRHISEIFGLGDREGLLDVLLDERLDLESAIVPTAHRGLSLLPTGKQTAGAAELLSSSRMRNLISNLCTRSPRRILLMDSPPLLVTNEARVLVKLAGQVVVVVRAGKTPKPAVQAAIALLDAQQAGGVVLNQNQSAAGEECYAYGLYGTDGAQT